ncbi:MAG: response regulator [Pseudomonadales bacterium]|nr:response regulator [Pseudomonadales bacterium]
MSTLKNTSMRAAFARRNLVIERYRRTRVLIIEDSAEARGVLRTMMSDAGVEKIDMVSSGQEAIESIQSHKYNLILCDYNLGKGKDGQQVLEEARFSKSLGQSTIFIMITAETSVEMVMGALEYQPDSYLTKPYSKKALMMRLDRAIASKIEYGDIERCYEDEQFNEAIKLCDAKIEFDPERAMRALRVKGECLFKTKRFEEAKALYSLVLEEKQVPWAKIGLGKSLFSLKEYEPAKVLFSELIQEQPNVVESYDWLSKIEVAQQKPREAQDTLEKAVSRSPKAVLRQMQLARLALSNRSYLVAEKSFKKSIKLANNSCYNTPNNYLQYIRTLLVKIDRYKSQISRDAFNEAKIFLGRLRKEFEKDALVEFRALMLEALVYFTYGDSVESDKMADRASSLYGAFERDTKVKLAEEYISGLTLVGRIEECQAFIHNMQKKANHPDLANRLLMRVKEGKQRIHCENLNSEAMSLYDKGQIIGAYEKFSEAAETHGASAAILLNALGVCMELAEREDLNREGWYRESKSYLERLNVLDRCDHRYESYLDFKSRYQALPPL